MDKLRADMDAIEDSIAQGDMSAAQVFTQMRQLAEAASTQAQRDLESRLVVGARVRIGEAYAKEHPNCKAGDIITLVRGEFEHENGLYTEHVSVPSIWDTDSREFDSIYHLFGNDLSGFMDCEVLPPAAPFALPAGFSAWLDAVVTVANATGMAHDEVIPTWPHYTDDDRKMFAEHPPLKVGDVMELDALLTNASTAPQVAVPEGACLIPLDTRYSEPRPLITNRMKAACIGEFTIPVDLPELDDDGETTGGCITVAATVPWDTMKAIYKRMASEAMLAAPTAPAGDTDCQFAPMTPDQIGERAGEFGRRCRDLNAAPAGQSASIPGRCPTDGGTCGLGGQCEVCAPEQPVSDPGGLADRKEELRDWAFRIGFSSNGGYRFSDSQMDDLLSIAEKLLSAPAPDEREIAATLERIVPRIDPKNPEPLHPTKHCCETTLYHERERIYSEIARLRAGKEGHCDD